MSITVSANTAPAIRTGARGTAAEGSVVKRLWERFAAAQRSRADREVAGLLQALGHEGLFEDFRQGCRRD